MNAHVPVAVPTVASPYSRFILQTGTVFSTEKNGVWTMANYTGDANPDLVYIKTANTGSGFTEVHVASAGSKYQNFVLQTKTVFAPENNGTWLFADFDGDKKPDLIYIKTRNTGSKSVEVHVASGSSNYAQFILQTGTVFKEEDSGVWTMADTQGTGKLDLVYIKSFNVESGKVEVHIASAQSNYRNFILQTGTTFGKEQNGVWLITNFSTANQADLVYVKTRYTGSKSVEVHVSPASSRYSSFILQTGTVFQEESDGTWLLSPRTKDLIYIKTSSTGTGKVEVHIASYA